MRKKPFRGYCQSGCGKEVFSRNPAAKFCSLSCSNIRFKKHFALRPCAQCSKIVPLAKQRFCSLRCFQDHNFDIRVKQIENGHYHWYNCSGFVRRYLIKKLGERCSRCQWDKRNPVTGRVPIEVEHIDGDWKNNRSDNLTLLCPNCHSLTDTYRALNRGRGRPYRLGGRENPLRNK